MDKKKRKVDQQNHDFVVSTIYKLAPKNAVLTVAIGLTENNEIMICSSNDYTTKQIYQILSEAAAAIQNKPGGLILLN
jgi:hypothetical protein